MNEVRVAYMWTLTCSCGVLTAYVRFWVNERFSPTISRPETKQFVRNGIPGFPTGVSSVISRPTRLLLRNVEAVAKLCIEHFSMNNWLKALKVLRTHKMHIVMHANALRACISANTDQLLCSCTKCMSFEIMKWGWGGRSGRLLNQSIY